MAILSRDSGAKQDTVWETCLLSSFALLRGWLLAGGADSRKLQGMADAGVTALLGDLILKSLHDALIDRLNLMAGTADQVVMMMVPIACPDLMPGRAVDPRNPLHEFLFFQNGDKPKNRGEVAAFRAHLLVNVGKGQGNFAGIKKLNDGDPAMSGAQAILPQPSGSVDGGRCRMYPHIYL
jgi:hypothetical protein